MFDGAWRLPQAWQWDNYRQAWNFGLGHYMVNSILVTTVSTALILLLGALTAFLLAVAEFRGKLLVYLFVMGGMILPPEVALFPLFRILRALGLYDTYAAMIVPYVAFGLPFSVFFLRAYMAMIPRDMHEAATIDGAGLLRSFWSIYLPVSRPALAAVAVIQGMKVWNEFMFALTFVESNRLRTLTVGISTFGEAVRVDWAVLMAGLVISIVPVLAAFLAMQRHFISGLTQGAVK
jgi:raffinose/stachyose/melibiose transport system permease protein